MRRGDGLDLGKGIDLSRHHDGFVGEIEPVQHTRVDKVYVVLKNQGELSEQHLYEIGEFAKAAAVAASRAK